MLYNKKLPAGTLLAAAGLAAYAYYRYSKMSEEEKSNLITDIKKKAQDIYEQYAPQEWKDVLKKAAAAAGNHFDQANNYTGH